MLFVPSEKNTVRQANVIDRSNGGESFHASHHRKELLRSFFLIDIE
jgi:hypothetical protein